MRWWKLTVVYSVYLMLQKKKNWRIESSLNLHKNEKQVSQFNTIAIVVFILDSRHLLTLTPPTIVGQKASFAKD